MNEVVERFKHEASHLLEQKFSMKILYIRDHLQFRFMLHTESYSEYVCSLILNDLRRSLQYIGSYFCTNYMLLAEDNHLQVDVTTVADCRRFLKFLYILGQSEWKTQEVKRKSSDT